MGSHLVISYRHDRATGEPLFAGNEVAACVARDARQQLTRGDDSVLAIDLERLARVRTMRVNDIAYELEWSTEAPVTDDERKARARSLRVRSGRASRYGADLRQSRPGRRPTRAAPEHRRARDGTRDLRGAGVDLRRTESGDAGAVRSARDRRPRRVRRTTTPNESHFWPPTRPARRSSSRRPGRTSSWAHCWPPADCCRGSSRRVARRLTCGPRTSSAMRGARCCCAAAVPSG